MAPLLAQRAPVGVQRRTEQVPETVRAEFEPDLGVDLSRVRVHRGGDVDESAQALQAKAFTVGSEVHLPGRHGPLEHGEGRSLLAHELTHVAQQQRLGASLPREDTPEGQRLEAEAAGAEGQARRAPAAPGHERAMLPLRRAAVANPTRPAAGARQRVALPRAVPAAPRHADGPLGVLAPAALARTAHGARSTPSSSGAEAPAAEGPARASRSAVARRPAADGPGAEDLPLAASSQRAPATDPAALAEARGLGTRMPDGTVLFRRPPGPPAQSERDGAQRRGADEPVQRRDTGGTPRAAQPAARPSGDPAARNAGPTIGGNRIPSGRTERDGATSERPEEDDDSALARRLFPDLLSMLREELSLGWERLGRQQPW